MVGANILTSLSPRSWVFTPMYINPKADERLFEAWNKDLVLSVLKFARHFDKPTTTTTTMKIC